MNKPHIRTSQDLQRLPKYLPSIDPKVQPLRRIVTHYYLSALFPCGLKDCHRLHKEGYLVELEDGNCTNVGWICGEHFGEKFTAEKRRYAEQEIKPKAISTIQAIKQRIQGMRDTLERMAAEADRLSRCKQGLRSQFPKLYQELERRANTGNDRVVEQVERSEKEIDDLLAMNPGSGRERFRYRDESRGSLPGLRVLALNVRDEVVTRFTAKGDAILSAEVASMSLEKLLDWEGWALRFDESLAGAQAVLASGNAFFAPNCFHLLTYITNAHGDKSALSKLTVATLLQGDHGVSGSQSRLTKPVTMSKKQRESQKRLEAILCNAGRANR